MGCGASTNDPQMITPAPVSNQAIDNKKVETKSSPRK